jgi:acyl-CoA reductase-like NAD-dependent aldehyde dehydrogenase
VWRRTTVTERAHVLHSIAELLSRDREEDAQLWGKRTGKPLYRAFLKDKFGSWR